VRPPALLEGPAPAIAVAVLVLGAAIALGVRHERRRRAALARAALTLGLAFAPRDPALARQPFLALPVFRRGRRRAFRDVARGDGIWVFEHRYADRIGKRRIPRRQTVAALRVAPGTAARSWEPEPGWLVEGEGEWVVVVRRHRRAAPEELAGFVARARELASSEGTRRRAAEATGG